MSFDDLFEREGLGDDRLQAAISQAVGDKTLTTLQTGRVAGRVERDLRQPKAAQDDGLRAYPNNPEARYAMMAKAKCSRAR